MRRSPSTWTPSEAKMSAYVNKHLLVQWMPMNKSADFSSFINISFQISVGFFFFDVLKKTGILMDFYISSIEGPDAYTRHIMHAPFFSAGAWESSSGVPSYLPVCSLQCGVQTVFPPASGHLASSEISVTHNLQ